MPVLLGTLTYKRNFQINYKFVRTSALDFACPWKTDLTLGLEFKEINWLPVRARFEQNVRTHIFKQQNNLAPNYIVAIFPSADQYKIKTWSSSYKLILPHCNRVSGHRTISFPGPKLWNKLPIDTKLSKNSNSFKHKVKLHFFEVLVKENDDFFVYY